MATVLVGETNQALNAELCASLEQLGLQHQAAFTGEEVVYYARRSLGGYTDPISLISVDINIRGLSGFGVVGKLRAIEGSRNIPLVVTVERYLTETLDDGFEMGVFGFFVKPMNMRKAAVTLKAVINGDTAKLRKASHAHDTSGGIVTKDTHIKRK